MVRKKKGKKGNLFDILFIGVFIFIMAITIIFSSKILHEVADGFNETLADDSFNFSNNETVTTLNTLSDEFDLVYDSSFVIIFMVLNIGVIVSAFWVRSHPAFFFVAVLLLIIFAFLNMIFSNTYFEIMSEPDLAGTALNFPMMTLVMRYLPYFTIVFSIFTIVVLYAKGGGQEG